jgi:hypothetical protein
MITMAERRFPVRIRIAVPPGSLGQRYARMTAWLDENCGAEGWAITALGTRGVLNDAASIYFLGTTLAGAFVSRWCTGYRVELLATSFRCAMMIRHRGAGRLCIGHREAKSASTRGCAPMSRHPCY